MSSRKSNDSLLARVNFPLYAIQMVTERHLLVAGGGGSAKTGVANCIELHELVKCPQSNTCRSMPVTRFNTGERAVMNATVFFNGKHHVLATGGMNGMCVLYQMRLIAKSDHQSKQTELFDSPSANGNGHIPNGNGNLRKRTTHLLSGDTLTSNGHAHTGNGTANGSAHHEKPDYPELTFEINQMTSFQADFNCKNAEESFLKVTKFSPSARILVTGGSDGCLRIFGYPDLQLRTTIQAHEQDIDDLDIDATGTKIVSISKDGHAYVWNIKTRSKCGELKLQTSDTSKNIKYMFRACRFSTVENDTNNITLFTAVNPLVRSKPANPSYICKWDATRYGLVKTTTPINDVFSSMAVR